MADEPIVFKDAVEREFWAQALCAFIMCPNPATVVVEDVADRLLRAFRERRRMEPPREP